MSRHIRRLFVSTFTSAPEPPPPPPPPLLLDTYTGAAAAYSLRRLNTSYTGAAIRVRRSSDNTEQDIGFTSDVLDTAALLSFTGASSGFITTWYDQSGNNRNVTQATAARQPRIVDAGVIETILSKPTLRFTRADNNILSISNQSFSASASRIVCFATVATLSTSALAQAIVYLTTGAGLTRFISTINESLNNWAVGGRRLDNNSYAAFLGAQTMTTDLNTMGFTASYTNATAVIHQNGSVLTSGSFQTAGNTSATNSTLFQIGAGGGGVNNSLDGYLSEIVIYNTAVDQAEFTSTVRSYYS